MNPIVDTSKANETLRAWAGVMGVAPAEATVKQARLLVRQCLGFTPPKNQAQGERAIESDLQKLFTPVDPVFLDLIGSEHGTKNIDTWITRKNKEKLHIQWDKLDPSGAGLVEQHQNYRNSRGRIPKSFRPGSYDNKTWRAFYAVSKNDLAEYIKKVKQFVGLQKSGWLPAYYALKGTVAKWISRHGTARSTKTGFVNDSQLYRPNYSQITIGNRARGISWMADKVHRALRARVTAMKREMKLKISGYSQASLSSLRAEKHKLGLHAR